jgi:GT2 family glycosyltransferase
MAYFCPALFSISAYMAASWRAVCPCREKTGLNIELSKPNLSKRNDNSKVTIIIVNWNGERFLERCLTALMNQTVKPHEIMLLDNGSSDSSVEIAQRFPSVQLMLQNRNTGFARGNNLAIEAASKESEWIALLNPDAFAEPRWLEALLTAAAQHPEFDVFGSRLLNATDPTLLDGAGDAYHVSGLVWRIGHGMPMPATVENTHEVFSPCAAAALYRRSALDKVGGFDEDYFCYLEDVDLGFRLQLAGYRCLYVPQSAAYHVGSGTTGGQHSDFSRYHGHRNLVWTFVKNMPGTLFWMLLPLHLLLNLFSIAYFLIQGQGKVILAAKRDAIKGIPKMWRKRRSIQSTRSASVTAVWHILNKNAWPANKP